jgi:beta-galactosidase
MAEPSQWITHDHDDMKRLNCVFTRVHWPQDKRVLDYCARHGILMQSEIPAWGYDPFAGMASEPSADILQNALEQLREMIARDRNHPPIVAWGLCNEIGGQNPPAYQFARHMLEESKRLDPNRLCSYASNSLDETPIQDVRNAVVWSTLPRLPVPIRVAAWTTAVTALREQVLQQLTRRVENAKHNACHVRQTEL